MVLQKLHELGIGSLMVEGGARVIASFFAHAHFVDSIIVTVAPKFVGIHGVGYGLDVSQVGLYCLSITLCNLSSRYLTLLIIPVIHSGKTRFLL